MNIESNSIEDASHPQTLSLLQAKRKYKKKELTDEEKETLRLKQEEDRAKREKEAKHTVTFFILINVVCIICVRIRKYIFKKLTEYAYNVVPSYTNRYRLTARHQYQIQLHVFFFRNISRI